MDKKITKKEYLEIKKQALIDRAACETELDNEDKIEIILDAYSEEYKGEAEKIYRFSFLIPNDAEFQQLHKSGVKGSIELKKHYPCINEQDILGKIIYVNKFGIYNSIDEIEEELKDSMEMLELPVEDPYSDEEEFSMLDKQNHTNAMFSPLVPNSSGERAVEKQTEDAISKINLLFQGNGSKDEKIKAQSEKIEDLEEEVKFQKESKGILEKENSDLKDKVIVLEEKNDELSAENSTLKDKLDELTVRLVGLEEENKALLEYKAHYDRIIRAINERAEEAEKTQDKKRL